ncbi:hypothetical protein JXB37_02840 [candidate division WOR-3 bacterium]|nr:hypothetical protein [candidate division WOR-3 bacterium]
MTVSGGSLPPGVHPDAKVGPLVHVDPEVEIGPGTIVMPGAVLLGRTRVGARCIVGPNAVVGTPGFGYEWRDGAHRRLEHSGEVIIEDDVELGAGVTVAMARTGRQTRIGQGTKVDCQVHIGHNVLIGEHCLLVGQVGVAGSARIGDRVALAGQVGVSDHVTIGDDAVVYAKSAVFRSVPAGERYSGIPARPHPATKRFWARLWRTFGGGK